MIFLLVRLGAARRRRDPLDWTAGDERLLRELLERRERRDAVFALMQGPPDGFSLEGASSLGLAMLEKPRVFYYDEAEAAWVPAGALTFSDVVDLTSLEDGEEMEIRIARFDMDDLDYEGDDEPSGRAWDRSLDARRANQIGERK